MPGWMNVTSRYSPFCGLHCLQHLLCGPLQIFQDLRDDHMAQGFRKALNKKEGIVAIGGTSKISSEGTQHSISGQSSCTFTSCVSGFTGNDLTWTQLHFRTGAVRVC